MTSDKPIEPALKLPPGSEWSHSDEDDSFYRLELCDVTERPAIAQVSLGKVIDRIYDPFIVHSVGAILWRWEVGRLIKIVNTFGATPQDESYDGEQHYVAFTNVQRAESQLAAWEQG